MSATAHPNRITVTRRARALPLNAVLWMLLCGIVVIVAHAVAAQRRVLVTEYWSGAIALIGFIALGWYSVRKRSLWFSLRMLRATARILSPHGQYRVVVMDRLETWRAVHITLGILVILPLWWHLGSGLMSPVEMLLAIAVALLLLSGMVGVVIQEYLPPAIETMAEREVRLEDVASRTDAVYVEAEEKVLGHPPPFVEAYIKNLRPVLEAERIATRRRLFGATMMRRDIGAESCAELRKIGAQFGDDAAAWNELVDLAARKMNLEHNRFNLNFSTAWMRFHIAVALCTFGLLVFHIAAVLYFDGL